MPRGMKTTAITMTTPKNMLATLVSLRRENLGDRRQDERADDRTEHAARAAEHRHDDHLDVERDVEYAGRIDEGDVVGIDAAGERGEQPPRA